MLAMLSSMMLAQAQECLFERSVLPGIRNHFLSLLRMAQEAAKVGTPEDPPTRRRRRQSVKRPQSTMERIMCRTPVVIGEISPDRANRTRMIMTGDVLYIIPLITRLLAKTNGVSFTIYLLPAFVALISREVVCQRR